MVLLVVFPQSISAFVRRRDDHHDEQPGRFICHSPGKLPDIDDPASVALSF